MKKLILKLIVQIIYKFKEHTSSEVKYSKRNHKVAAAALAIGVLINEL